MVYLRMLLQENGAATKVQKGKIVHLPTDLFHMGSIDFPLHDYDKKEDEEEKEEEEDEEEEEKEEEVTVTNKYE